MMPDERRTLEASAERHLRRGELREAVSLLQQLVQTYPGDAALIERLAQLEENLQPAELMSPKAALRSDPKIAPSPMHDAEALASRGDFAGAITIYRQLLAQNPAAELVRERLAELFQLAQARSPARPTGSSRAQVLEHLLERITSRRRS
jgi:tetratricopeptide (TPR) repeat protein